MKQKQLLIGLGLGLLAYYLYTRSKNKASATPEEKANSNTTLPNAGGVVAPNPIPSPSVNTSDVGVEYPFSSKKEQDTFYEEFAKKYGVGNLPKRGDKIITSYGTYEYSMKQRGGKLGQAFTMRWEKRTNVPNNPQVYAAPTTRTIGELLKK